MAGLKATPHSETGLQGSWAVLEIGWFPLGRGTMVDLDSEALAGDSILDVTHLTTRSGLK